MSGLYELIRNDGSDVQERINVSAVRTELTAFAFGLRTGAEAKASLETLLGRVLDTAEATDLTNISTQFNTGTTEDKLTYAAKLEFVLNGSEINLVDETLFRSVLGIS